MVALPEWRTASDEIQKCTNTSWYFVIPGGHRCWGTFTFEKLVENFPTINYKDNPISIHTNR